MISYQSLLAEESAPLFPSQREPIEWSDLWLSHSTEDNKPRVLLIGDSIVRAFYPDVEKQLQDKAFVGRLSTSFFASDPLLLSQIIPLLNNFRFDIIYLNNGMHGWIRTEEEYAKGLALLVATVRAHAPAAKIIIGNTTPLKEGPVTLDPSEPSASRIIQRNDIATALAKKEGLALCDMYTPLEKHPEYYTDNIHFNEKGITIQAQLLSQAIEHALSTFSP